MVRRCSVALLDGAEDWHIIFLDCTNDCLHSPATAVGDVGEPHWVPLFFSARQLCWMFCAPPGHAVYHMRAQVDADLLLWDLSQVSSQCFFDISEVDEDW